MQLGNKNRKGDRCFLRPDGMLIINKRGKVRVAIGNTNECQKPNTGTPSTFKQLGKAL
ncbi:MAG: hypothetical protein ACTH8P_16820 [Ewingella sp.]|uniref:hypothetical protein n=1 Tax=Ewingella sp. TaxID=1897459 RepID=UPI003F9084B2